MYSSSSFSNCPSSSNSSPVAIAICAIGAFIAALVFTTAATQQLHSVSSRLSSTSLSTTASTQRSLSTPLRVSRPLSQETSRHMQAGVAEAYEGLTQRSDTVPRLLVPGLCCVAGLLGFLWSKAATPSAAPLAMVAVSARRTMAETKLSFLQECDASIPNMYNIPLQELLAQHHLIRYNTKYQYDELFALGIVTVINQLLEGLPEEEINRIQRAYFTSLGDDVEQFKRDAAMLEEWATSKGKEMNMAGDDETTQRLKAIAERVAGGEFQYSKFFSIGVFQLLQQAGQSSPDNFVSLVTGLNLDKERVTKDLKVYKDLLKRLEMAKDMKEKFLERERKKQQERLAKKTAAAM